MRFPLLVLLVMLLAACGTTLPAPSGEPVLVVTDGVVEGPGLSVADALDHQATDDIVTVSGALFVNADGTVILCDAIAESFPAREVLEALNHCFALMTEVVVQHYGTIDKFTGDGIMVFFGDPIAVANPLERAVPWNEARFRTPPWARVVELSCWRKRSNKKAVPTSGRPMLRTTWRSAQRRHHLRRRNPLFELLGGELDRGGVLAGGLADRLLLLFGQLDADGVAFLRHTILRWSRTEEIPAAPEHGAAVGSAAMTEVPREL